MLISKGSQYRSRLDNGTVTVIKLEKGMVTYRYHDSGNAECRRSGAEFCKRFEPTTDPIPADFGTKVNPIRTGDELVDALSRALKPDDLLVLTPDGSRDLLEATEGRSDMTPAEIVDLITRIVQVVDPATRVNLQRKLLSALVVV